MDILLRSARIIDTGSPFHNKVKDVLISNGIIVKIGNKLPKPAKAREVWGTGLHVSMGWCDLNAFFGDPGFEQIETIETGCLAAAAGGYTHVCLMPGTQPAVHEKAQVEYVLRKAQGNVVTVCPVGAVTRDCAGKDMAEMYDMKTAGAVSFSDGLKPSLNSGLLERALRYIKAFDGVIMVHPEDKYISTNGVMHEGVVSTRMGLPGMPALAEEVAVNRDIFLLEYTGSRLHLLDISTARSVELIRQARKRKLNLSASVNAYNLVFDETAVAGYDTLYKVNPPLRSKSDILALMKGISDGTIDTVTSAHQPHDEEGKNLEFDKAGFGITALETAYAAANTVLHDKLEAEKIVGLFSANPRRILGVEGCISEGEKADMTLFNPEEKWVFTAAHQKSKSRNTPFIGFNFTGKAIGIINNGQIHLNS